MIDWKVYDKSKPPPLFHSYLVYNGQIHTAWFDKMGGYSDINMFHKQGGGFHLGVTHYADINLPE